MGNVWASGMMYGPVEWGMVHLGGLWDCGGGVWDCGDDV